MRSREKVMTANAKVIVTVQSVRVANRKMMSASRSPSAPPPAAPSHNVYASIRNVAEGGQVAMRALKKA